jgi:hypothetical protein
MIICKITNKCGRLCGLARYEEFNQNKSDDGSALIGFDEEIDEP